jgi:hypothetical protein
MERNNTKLIGQGSYGCVFKPSFKTKKDILNNNGSNNDNNNGINTSKTKKISKLVVKSKDKELKQLQRLHEVNSEGKYHPKFNPDTNVINTTETDELLSQPHIREKFKDCKVISSGKSGDKYIINMEFGGEDLKKYFNNQGTLSKDDTYYFLRNYINLINGLMAFKKNKLSIMDIKDKNIVYNQDLQSEHKMRFIDFGTMLDYGRVSQDELLLLLSNMKYLFIYDYSNVYPPEILLLIDDVFELIYNYTQLVSNSGNNLTAKRELMTNLRNYELKDKKLGDSKLGSLFISMIDVYIKMFKMNIKKYNYTKDDFHYRLSKKILSLIDTYSLLSVIKKNKQHLNDDDGQITKILEILPPYEKSINMKTLFSLPKLTNIKQIFQQLLE